MKVLGNLNIKGQVTIVDGTQGNNKVLTSDADGAASWVELSGIVGGMVSDTNTHVSSGQLNGTNLDLLLSDGSSVPSIDLSDLLDDTNLWTKKAVGNNIYRDIGNVGIGLTSPENRLSVKRTIGIMNDDWNNANGTGSRLLMGLNSTAGDDFSYIQAQDAGGTSNNNLILQRYGGRVGIGTTSPGTNLHILAGEGSDAVIRIEADPDNTTGTETDNPRVEFVQDGGNIESAIGHNLISSGDQNVLQIANSVGTGGGILFATDTQNTGYSNADPRMLITGDGDVGIGTTSPDSKLHVDGQVKIVDGSEGVDKVLTSDASGLASWEDLSSMVSGLVSDTNNYVVSGIIQTTQNPNHKLPDTTDLILTLDDGSTVNIDISDLKDDVQPHTLNFDNNTNVLTLTCDNPNKGEGQIVDTLQVDLSSMIRGLGADTNNYVTTGKLVGNILTLERNGGLSDITVDMSQFIDNVDTNTYVIGGSVVKGAVACDHKIRLELNNGSFIAGAIDVSSLASDHYVSDLTLVGTQLTLKQSNECGNEKPTFQVDLSSLTSGLSSGGDSDWTVVGNNMYSTPSGLVGIGVTTPNHKLHVSQDSANDIIHVDSSHSSFSYGGASGIGNKTNNVILKHKDTGGDNTSSSWQTRGSDDKIAIEVTTYFSKDGSEISYNAIAMHAGEGKVSILSADNDADDAILSIQSDSKIGFQNNSTSWPSGKKETMTIDLTTDRVGINAESPDCNLHLVGQIKIVDGTQSQGKVLTSNADGLASWQTPAGGTSFPVGSIIQFAGDTAPAGWLMCDGSLKNALNYGVLYSVIGTTYGVGESEPGFGEGPIEEGGDTFRVPNLNGRVPVGRNNNDSDFNSLGETGGKKEETLAASQIPHKSHTHTINDSGSGHYHPIGWVHDGEAGIKTDGGGVGKAHHVLNAHATKSLNVFQDYVITGNHTYGNKESVGHQSSIDIGNGKSAISDTSQGEHSHSMSSGSPDDGSAITGHNNLQPYIVLNYIIYAGV